MGSTGLGGVVMNGLPGNPTTDSSGNYSNDVDQGWSGTVTPTKEGYSFSPSSRNYSNVNSDQTGQDYSASIIQYTLTINVGSGGTTNPSPGTYTYNRGESLTVRAIPDTNYRFDKWTGDASGGNNPLTITMDGDKTIKANFIRLYTLTVEVGEGGTTSPSPGTYKYDTGTTAQITAVPNTNYRFSNWSGDASGTSNPITILMDRDKTIKANFIRQYSLTIEAGEGGTTTPIPGTYKYDTGTTVQVTAVPNDYYIFNNWTGTVTGTSNPISLLMTKDFSIKANFRLIEPPLNFSGQKVLNRSLSQAEYINVLSWQGNPNNADLTVIKFRIYQVNFGNRDMIAELNPNVLGYWHRKVDKESQYDYEIAVVLDNGKEGKPATLSIR